MLHPIEGLPHNVVAFSAEGAVTASDYSEHLVPAIECVLEEGHRPRMLYVLGPKFERFELGAMLADARAGLGHFSDFERIAVVTGHDLIENAVRAFGVLMPCPVRTFDNDELDAAKVWIGEEQVDALELSVDRVGSVARLEVHLRGSLDRAAEDQLVRAAHEGIGDAEEVHVLVDATDFHGWRELRALWHHVRFVTGMRPRLERVAIVGERKWQRRLVSTAHHILRVDARFFDASELEAARAWFAG